MGNQCVVQCDWLSVLRDLIYIDQIQVMVIQKFVFGFLFIFFFYFVNFCEKFGKKKILMQQLSSCWMCLHAKCQLLSSWVSMFLFLPNPEKFHLDLRKILTWSLISWKSDENKAHPWGATWTQLKSCVSQMSQVKGKWSRVEGSQVTLLSSRIMSCWSKGVFGAWSL